MGMAEARALFASAHALCERRSCDEAVSLWEQASSLRPADPDIHYQLGFCYAGGCGVENLLDPEVAVFHYRRALSLASHENAVGRAMILGALANAYVRGAAHAGPRLLSAIYCYEEAAQIFARLRRLDDWAREQFNLGNAWCEMPGGDFPEKWRRAIEHYERALSIRTRLKDPRQYAATLQNLGTAYRELTSGDPGSNNRRAVKCYHQAMRALRGVAPGSRLADLHHNLGNAYLSLAGLEADEVRNLRRAIRHLTVALRSRNEEASIFEYAATQFSLGQAYLRMAASDEGSESAIQNARSCLAEAFRAFSRCGQTELADQVKKCFGHVAVSG
jgi:tetratricopeptide (TPR) repeat protein